MFNLKKKKRIFFITHLGHQSAVVYSNETAASRLE